MAAKKRFNKEIFVRVYAMTGNGTQAAIAAGSTENSAATTAWRMLKNVDILSRVREEQQKLAEQACLTEEYVLLQLKDVYEKCSAAKPVMEWDYFEHKMVKTGEYTFDSKGALRAMEMIGNNLGMFKGNKQNPFGGQDQKEDDPLTRALKEEAERMKNGGIE